MTVHDGAVTRNEDGLSGGWNEKTRVVIVQRSLCKQTKAYTLSYSADSTRRTVTQTEGQNRSITWGQTEPMPCARETQVPGRINDQDKIKSIEIGRAHV